VNEFDVSVYAIRRRSGRRRPFEVRWRAAGRSRSKSFITRKLADSYRAELVRAARMGLDFDPLTGEPTAWNLPEPAIVTWYEEATAYAVMKWPSLAAHSRASLAESLATVTPVLTQPGARNRPNQRELRMALYQHAFNPARPAGLGSPAAQILNWARQASLPVGCLSEPAVLRTALEALTFRLDGSRAAANTIIRKRVVLHGARLRGRGWAAAGQPFGQLRLARTAIVSSPRPCRRGQPRTGQRAAGYGHPDAAGADRLLRLPVLRRAPPGGGRRPAPRRLRSARLWVGHAPARFGCAQDRRRMDQRRHQL
jgi:hypothetical protein